MVALSRRTWLAAASAGVVGAATGALTGSDAAQAKIVDSNTKRKYGPVAILGDSASGGYLNGLKTSLAEANVGPYRFDIKGSRRITESWLSYDSGVSAAKKMIASGYRPRAWVVGLGSNDFYFFRRKLLSPRDEIEEFLDAVGSRSHVAWLTIWTERAGAYAKTFNSVLYDLADKHSRFHVVDWASVARKHPEWLMDDGAHLKMPGAKARNEYLAKAAVVAAKAAGARGSSSSGSSGSSGSSSNSTSSSGSGSGSKDRPTLELGSSGDAVKRLQRLLTDRGIYVRADGDFGAATERAVIRFQRAEGLRPDGVVGPVTWRKLEA